MSFVNKTIYFCLGVGATSSLLALVFGGRVLSMLNIFLVLSFFDLIVSTKRKGANIHIRKSHSKLFLMWMTVGLISSLYGIFRFMEYEEFMTASLGSFIKIIIYLLYFYLLSINADYQSRIKHLIGGIKFGIILNLIWCIADAGLFYTTSQSLTNTVFKSYIEAMDMRLGMASIIDGFMIRSVGLNNDPATVGFFSIVVAAYSYLTRKYSILILSVLSSFACVSFTAIVGIMMVSFYYLFFGYFNIKKKFTLLFSVIFISIVGFLYFNYSDSDVAVGVRTSLEMRAEAKMDGAATTEVREFYIKNFLPAVATSPDALIIGTGFNTASFPYFSLGLQNHEEFRPFDMENTYIATFFDIGLIGLFLFLSFYFMLFKKTKVCLKNGNQGDFPRVVNATSISALISFLFYHYTLYSVLMFISIAAILINCNKIITDVQLKIKR